MHIRRFIIVGIILLLTTGGIAIWLYSQGYFNPHTRQSAQPSSQLTYVSAAENQTTCINALPIDIKIGQKLMAAGYSSQLSSEASVFNARDIGGIIIMDQALGVQLSAFRNAQSIQPFIATDQEGGTVQRYTIEGILSGATDMASGFSPSQAYDQYLQDDQYLKSIGITTNFAPIVGVISAVPSPLPGRMYSSDPNVVVMYSTKAIKASQASGITPVIKHFPGLGSAVGNTDYGSTTTNPLTTLKTRDLLPYQQLASLKPDVMVSNVIVPNLTNSQPAVWSPAAITLLRSEGYQQSVVYSDSLTAKAIPGLLSDAVVKPSIPLRHVKCLLIDSWLYRG